MNPKIINLLIIGLIPVLCLSQTILFENIHSRDDENNLDFLESTEFLCQTSNSTKSLNLNYTGLEKLPENFVDRSFQLDNNHKSTPIPTNVYIYIIYVIYIINILIYMYI